MNYNQILARLTERKKLEKSLAKFEFPMSPVKRKKMRGILARLKSLGG